MRPYVLSLLACMLLLTGCPAVRLSREAAELAEAGRPYPAAMHYLDALEENPRLKRAQAGLDEVKAAAYEARLAAAREAEEAERYPDALTAYRELRTLLERLQPHGGLGTPAIDVAERIDAMENAAADVQYRRGEQMLGNRAFDKAVEAYRKALEFKAGYRDAAQKVGVAFFAWAESDEQASSWRAAAGHYTEAAAAGHAEAASRAGAILAALGRHHLDAGTCRQAVRDYRAARAQVGVTAIKDGLAAAEACARTPVAFVPFANPTRGTPGGVAVPDVLADALRAAVAGGASEFVDALDRTALDRLLASARTTAAKASAAGRLAGAHWLVVGEFGKAAVNAPREVVTERTVAGWVNQPCESDAAQTCRKDVTLRYFEHEARVEVRVAGQLRVVDARSGAQSASWPFDVTKSDATRYADGFVGPDGRAVRVVRADPDVARGEVAVPVDVVELRDARRALVAPAELARVAVEEVARQGAGVVVGVVDAEPPLQDPVVLRR